jgi:predicted RNA-binding Zn-ribbon protein involved in translation (DUF1610 family)
MEDNQCPECGNEIYKPYNYCNACGWERSEEEELRDAKKESKKKGKSAPETAKAKKPTKLKCKCGETIIVKSLKRPIKIECSSCGRTGSLKAPPKTAKSKDEKPSKPDKETKPKKDKTTTTKKPVDKDKVSEKKLHRKSELRSRKSAVRTKRGVPSKKRDRPQRDISTDDDDYCPECGTRLGMTGLCPNCGYRAGPGITHKKVSRTGQKKTKSKKHKPPKGARPVKPKKGVCSKCDSKNLRFYDDGSGRCSDCGREFEWDAGASRLQQDEYECPKCGDMLEWIEQYQRWYCHSCGEYQ